MKVQKGIYVLVASFLGGMAGHKFYAGKWIMGVLYLLFSWVFFKKEVSDFESKLPSQSKLRKEDLNE